MIKTNLRPHDPVMSFAEDNFDLAAHKRASDAVAREKARIKRVRRQVKIGKIMLAVVTVIVFIILVYLASEFGMLNFR